MLQAQNITKIFSRKHGSVAALDQVSLKVNKGDFVSIVGPSGSGKSTLLLALGGMSTPSGGEVLYNGSSLYSMGVSERSLWRALNVGFVFQSFNLIPYLTVYENVSAGLALSGEKNIKEEKIINILDKMKLSDRSDHLPSELSVGQQQRVALARALVKDPHILFADEPTGNLDPDTGHEIMDIIKDQNKNGKTVVIITHDPNIAKIAKRSVKIIDGKIAG